MRTARAVLVMKFNSTHSPKKLSELCQEDLDLFRKVLGLLQKYDIAEERTGALGGIYLFETKSARQAFWTSGQAASIPTRYGVIPDSFRVEEYDLMTQFDDATTNSHNNQNTNFSLNKDLL